MAIRTTCILGAILAGLGTGCAGHAEYDPFLVPEDRIYGTVKTIALYAVLAPSELGSVDPQRGKFAALIAAQLEAAGFTVVPPEVSDSIWTRLTDSLGGLHDSHTGERDTVKLNTARTLAMSELQARFHADAWLHPYIVFSDAKYEEGDAQWDGAKQSYQSLGKKLLTALLGEGTSGKTKALSLWVVMEDMDGEELYENQGGLQLYMIPQGQDVVKIDPAELYADSKRNSTAVRLALEPLVTRKAK